MWADAELGHGTRRKPSHPKMETANIKLFRRVVESLKHHDDAITLLDDIFAVRAKQERVVISVCRHVRNVDPRVQCFDGSCVLNLLSGAFRASSGTDSQEATKFVPLVQLCKERRKQSPDVVDNEEGGCGERDDGGRIVGDGCGGMNGLKIENAEQPAPEIDTTAVIVAEDLSDWSTEVKGLLSTFECVLVVGTSSASVIGESDHTNHHMVEVERGALCGLVVEGCFDEGEEVYWYDSAEDGIVESLDIGPPVSTHTIMVTINALTAGGGRIFVVCFLLLVLVTGSVANLARPAFHEGDSGRHCCCQVVLMMLKD